MSFEVETPDEVQTGGGGSISKPGTYHMTVTNIIEGAGKKGKAIDGFTVECEVMDGTVSGCYGSQWSETFFRPNPEHSEASQKWSQRKMAAFLIAVGVLDPNQLGGKKASVELSEAVGRQFMVELQKEREFNGATGKYDIEGKYLEIAFDNLYHVDDPGVKDIPKNADALGLIPQEHRHDAAWFAFKKKESKQASGANGKQQPATAAASADSFDDL